MLKINIIAVGKIKEKYLTDACNEYIKRLGAFCNINITEIAEHKCAQNPSDADIDAVLKNEGKRILAAIPQSAEVIAMCIEGEMLSSDKLAAKIQKSATSGTSCFCFVIGGSWGLDESVKQRADYLLSMSPMTFPHMLARVMLLEQIYRAFSINKGTKYHK